MSVGVFNALLLLFTPIQPITIPNKYIPTVDGEIIEQCIIHGVEPYFALQIAFRESRLQRYPPHSKHGAVGVMQLMPLTKRIYGAENDVSWRDNVRAGVQYISDLQHVYKTPKLVYQHYTGTYRK